MRVDVFTTLVAISAIVLVLGLQVVFFWSRDRQSIWLAWCGSAFLLGGGAVAFYFQPPAGHEFVSLAIGNAFRILAFGFLWHGTRLFGGRKPEILTVLLASLVWMALCSVPAFLASLPLRMVIVSTLIVLFCCLSAWELWRQRAEQLPSRLPAIAVLLSFAGLTGLRIPLVNFMPFPMGALPENAYWLAGFCLLVALHATFFAALVIAMTKERRELEQRNFALRDPMTGLLNRRAFLDHAARHARRRRPGREQLGMLVLDLDHFKSINDRFGHDVGDRVLSQFADVARLCVRPADLAFRMGGEEFCFLLPDADTDVARAVAERIRCRFADTAVDAQGEAVAATVSIGVAVADQPGFDLEVLLASADAALYEAKARGRNITVIAGLAAIPRPASLAVVPARDHERSA